MCFRIAAQSYSSVLLHGIIAGFQLSSRLPWLPDDVSEASYMLERFESINQALMDWESEVYGTMEALIASIGNDAMRQLSETVDRIKS